MDSKNIKLRYTVTSLFLLSLCMVAGFRVVVSIILMIHANQSDAIKSVEMAIAEKRLMLSKCQEGSLMDVEWGSILDDDESSKIIDEIRAYGNNITIAINNNSGNFDISLAPNITEMVEDLIPEATLIREGDIAQSILDNYPYMDYQLPHLLQAEFYRPDEFGVVTLMRQGESIKLVLFENKKISYEMHILDTFPLNEVMNDHGRIQIALYHVPPPADYNTNRPYGERAAGCDIPQYVEMDCDTGPIEIKLRFADGKAYYYYGHQNKPYSRSDKRHKW